MNLNDKTGLREKLAAEYVLGTLRGGARRRFETWLRQDAALRAQVAQWQTHLAPLNEALPERAPPERVWQAITARIPAFGQQAETRAGWWNSLAFWRGLALATTAAAVFTIGINVLRGPTPAQVQQVAVLPSVVATITDDKTGEPLAFLMLPARGDELIVKVVANIAVPDDKILQLWMAPEQVPAGAPALASLGLVARSARSAPLQLSVANLEVLRSAKALGLSLEPAGGSPQPTLVLGHGKWTKLTT